MLLLLLLLQMVMMAHISQIAGPGINPRHVGALLVKKFHDFFSENLGIQLRDTKFSCKSASSCASTARACSRDDDDDEDLPEEEGACSCDDDDDDDLDVERKTKNQQISVSKRTKRRQ